MQLIRRGGRWSGGRAIGEMNIGELFSSVLLSRVTDVMGNLEGLHSIKSTVLATSVGEFGAYRIFPVSLGATPRPDQRLMNLFPLQSSSFLTSLEFLQVWLEALKFLLTLVLQLRVTDTPESSSS